jgi:hypothetical protein
VGIKVTAVVEEVLLAAPEEVLALPEAAETQVVLAGINLLGRSISTQRHHQIKVRLLHRQ